MLRLVLLSSVLLVAYVHAFPSGAPSEACDDMVPQHGVGAQNSTAPYSLDVTKTSDQHGNVCYHIEVHGSGKSFKGFFVQARNIDNGPPSSDQPPLGMFDILDTKTTHARICGNTTEVNGVTHIDSSEKTSVQLLWYPHGVIDFDQVKIIASVVEAKETFWVGIRKAVEK